MFLRTCQLSLLLMAGAIFTACSGSSGSSSTYNPAVGPFDENGNYVEAWADNPPKRNSDRRVASNPKPTPAPVVAKVTPTPAPRVVSRPTPVPVQRPVIVPPAPAPRPVAPIAVAPRPVAPVAVAPRPVAPVAVTPAPRPIAVTAPAPTQAVRRHTVGRGDTLFGLARKYGTSVNAIKSANRISGTTIITGRSYIIPR